MSGIVSLFFGVTWVAYAAVQPLDQYTGGGACYGGPQQIAAIPNIPPCFTLSLTASIFYTIGGIALAAAIAILAIRIIIAVNESREKKISPTQETKASIVTEKN
jgi:hypothetical protein